MRPALLRGHTKPITAVKFNFDGDLLFTASAEKVVNVWYSLSGERIGSFDTKAAVRTIDITNNSDHLIVGTNVGFLEIFKIDGGKRLGFLSMDARILTVQLSYGDKQLLTLVEWYSGSKNGTTEILIYDFDEILAGLEKQKGNGDELKIAPKKEFGFKSKYIQVAWGRLNETIYAAQANGTLDQIDLEGKIVRTVRAHDERMKSFSISKDFAFIVTCARDGAKLIDPEDLSILKTYKTNVEMNAGCISPLTFAGKNPRYHGIIGGGVPAIEAAGTLDGGFEVRLISLVEEEEIGKIAGHFGPVNTLNFYPDGRGFVSGGEEGIVRLFRFNEKYFKEFE